MSYKSDHLQQSAHSVAGSFTKYLLPEYQELKEAKAELARLTKERFKVYEALLDAREEYYQLGQGQASIEQIIDAQIKLRHIGTRYNRLTDQCEAIRALLPALEERLLIAQATGSATPGPAKQSGCRL